MACSEFYVSPSGNDRWSGRLPEANETGTDGPFASLEKARDTILELKRVGYIKDPVTVWIRGGIYRLRKPIEFTPADSYPVCYRAYREEVPVFRGSLVLDGWQESVFNGIACWVTDVSAHLERYGRFNSLFVGTERRPRCRYPKTGFLQVHGIPGIGEGFDLYGKATSYFDFAEGDLQPWASLVGAEVVVKHLWIEERLPVRRVDWERRRLYFERSSIFVMSSAHGPEGADYWLEHVGETCTEPGEWYLDEAAGLLYYLPREGEVPGRTEIHVPVVTQFVRMHGKPEENRLVRGIRLEGLVFECSDWFQGGSWDRIFDPCLPPGKCAYDASYRVPGSLPDPRRDRANVPQAAAHLPGAISFMGAENCGIEDCRVAHVGFYGVNIGSGCRAIRIVGNEIVDMGGGGVKVGGGDHTMPFCLRTGGNVIADNHIHDGGLVNLSAIGVALLHSFENLVVHNHIHDLYYSGVSCGWVWGYSESVSRDNLIAYNHIHDLGKGYISDMGAIYMLGVQPGTVLRGNLIHHVESQRYGGWGIYLDEGSSHMLIENNVIHHTQCAGFNQHFGRENNLRNNIIAFCNEGLVSLSVCEEHISLVLTRNIILCDRQSPFHAGYAANAAAASIQSDCNCIWDISGKLAEGSGAMVARGGNVQATRAAWQASGLDCHSLFRDPGFADPAKGDFSLPGNSPVLEMGFQPIDLREVGPRPPGKREFSHVRLSRRYRLYRDMDQGLWP